MQLVEDLFCWNCSCIMVKQKGANVLYVPKLSFNLLSVLRMTEKGKTVTFNEAGCQISDRSGQLIGVASKVGSLYHIDCIPVTFGVYVNVEKERDSGKEKEIYVS